MGCKHKNTSDGYGECTYDAHGFIVYEVEFRECLDCGAWLPLGPARDTEQTAIEVRAAEIAASREPDDTITATIVEGFGYDRVDVKNPDEDWHAGYLARRIVETETP